MVGNDIACDILIRHFRRLGLSVDAANEEGLTALLMAAKHGNITCAQILVGQGKASLRHTDLKHGYSVEEWLAKKGFTMQDIKPVRHDGKGRTRFLRVANIAAVCSAPKKVIHPQPPEYNYHMGKIQVERMGEEDDYLSDGTTVTDTSLAMYRYGDLEFELDGKHYRVVPYNMGKPKMKNQETQTFGEGEKGSEQGGSPKATVQEETSGNNKKSELKQKTKQGSSESKDKGLNKHSTVSNTTSLNPSHGHLSDKRLSLPDIEVNSAGNIRKGADRKGSLDALPEKLIANIDLGDGRRHSIQIHTDTFTNQVYWTPYKNGDDEEDTEDRPLLPLKFDRARLSVSDSETSTTDFEGPIF